MGGQLPDAEDQGLGAVAPLHDAIGVEFVLSGVAVQLIEEDRDGHQTSLGFRVDHLGERFGVVGEDVDLELIEGRLQDQFDEEAQYEL